MLPNHKLACCLEYLTNEYRERLDTDLVLGPENAQTDNQPQWKVMSRHDLKLAASIDDPSAIGLVIDPEVGVMLYLIPFLKEESIHSQITRALSLQSGLAVERNYGAARPTERDPNGAWRVVLHWLVDLDHRGDWTGQIAEVRRKTGFSEEIAFDATFVTPGDPRSEIARHGFPRLLIATRQVFRKEQARDVAQWHSADDSVVRALAGFSSRFSHEHECQFAKAIEVAVNIFGSSPNSADGGTEETPSPQRFRSLHIKDFRNLKDLRIETGGGEVGVSVVHGPNGTGKSSVCEAISIALFGHSERFRRFASTQLERDVQGRDRRQLYKSQYLTSLADGARPPTLNLNDGGFAEVVLEDPERLSDRDAAASGTVLEQDTCLQFSRMSASELGASLLRGYSRVADEVEALTETAVSEAENSRKEFLSGLGLPASVTKPETALDKIARAAIDAQISSVSRSAMEWIEAIEPGRASLKALFDQWGAIPRRGSLAEMVVRSAGDHRSLVPGLQAWFEQGDSFASQCNAEISEVIGRVGGMQVELPTVVSEVQTWGNWLQQASSAPATALTPQSPALVERLARFDSALKDLTERGTAASNRLEHLERTRAYLTNSWAKAHSEECPTCGSGLKERGGILAVVDSLLESVKSERDSLRANYSKLNAEATDLRRQLPAVTSAPCPIAPERQQFLTASLQWLVPDSTTLSLWISKAEGRNQLVGKLRHLQSAPQLLQRINAEEKAGALAEQLEGQFADARAALDRPRHLKAVREALNQVLSDVVSRHLPETIERLWIELVMNLTSASWLLPDRPRFEFATKRSEKTAKLGVKSRLARYVLNQSEVHVLGLAWFFTRYFTSARFANATMVLDDPAQELDQTSFRELCRLLEAVVRLHKIYERPLGMVLLLNQESRAVEAARATGGLLTVLGWRRLQYEVPSAMAMISPEFYALTPAALLKRSAS